METIYITITPEQAKRLSFRVHDGAMEAYLGDKRVFGVGIELRIEEQNEE